MLNASSATTLLDIKFIIKKIGLGENDCIAELGCGSFGYFVYPLAKAVGKNGRVFAVDILQNALGEIKKRAQQENLKQVETVWSNLEIFKATKIESSSLDTALMINLLSQSDKKAEIIREAARLLKRGGKLAIVEWKNSALPFGPSPEKRLKLESMKMAAPQLSLKLEEEFEAGPYHFGLIFKKIWQIYSPCIIGLIYAPNH